MMKGSKLTCPCCKSVFRINPFTDRRGYYYICPECGEKIGEDDC